MCLLAERATSHNVNFLKAMKGFPFHLMDHGFHKATSS